MKAAAPDTLGVQLQHHLDSPAGPLPQSAAASKLARPAAAAHAPAVSMESCSQEGLLQTMTTGHES